MKWHVTFLIVALLILLPGAMRAQTIDASTLLPSVSIQFSPASGSFVAGSTFEVPVLLDTRGASVNTVRVRVYYDPALLSIVRPSSDQSIIGLWLEPPSYDNTEGVAEYVGAIPNGITTSAGVIGTITFQAKKTGTATLSIRSDSEVLLNDGLGSQARIDAGRATYQVRPQPPAGLVIFSETHPLKDEWYNNTSPVFTWEKADGVTGFSYVLDTIPTTIPPSEVTTTEPIKGYDNLKDGIWYFHVKALKDGVWGQTGHYAVRIDSTPPAEFKPSVQYVLAAAVVVERALVSFFTTDNLSGIDRYEVGILDKASSVTESPVFIEAESPFQVPTGQGAGAKVLVRAFDGAGNVREASLDVSTPLLVSQFLSRYGIYLLVALILLLIGWSLLHFLYGHHILARIRHVRALLKREEQQEKEALAHLESEDKPLTPLREVTPAIPEDISTASTDANK